MIAFLHQSLLLLFLLSLYYAWRAFYSLWWKPKTLEKRLRKLGFIGNTYRFLYGDAKEEREAMKKAWSCPMDRLTHGIVPRFLPFIHQTMQRYGRNTLIWRGTRPAIVVMEPEVVKEVFLNKSSQLIKPKGNPLTRNLTTGLYSLEGEEGTRRRKIINPSFHQEKLRDMMPAFVTSCVGLIKIWHELADTEGYCELDVFDEFSKLTTDVISRSVYGTGFENGKRFFQLQKEQAKLAFEAAATPYIPGFRFIPTAKNRRRKQVDKELTSILRTEIDKKMNPRKTRLTNNKDLLGFLLELSQDKNNGMTTEDVIDECKFFYFGGMQTTSAWLTWTLVLLSVHPIWQQRAREEVLRIFGKNTPNFDSLYKLKTVTAILNEVLRLYPLAPILSRHVSKDTKIGELILPAGTDILLPIILIHHDREYWGNDAEEFNPERFSNDVSKSAKNNQNAFFPFGWGPRICLGQNFAAIEAKLALAIILQHFCFELSPSYIHAPYFLIPLQPQHGAHIILRPL